MAAGDALVWWQYVVLVLYYLVLPVVWLLEHLIALLVLVLAPLLHVLSYALHAALIPFRLLARLETLYIFFGTAVLLGLFTGLFLYAFTNLLDPVLGIRPMVANAIVTSPASSGSLTDQDDEDYVPASGRTAASFNAERAEKRAKKARQQAILGLGARDKGKGPVRSSITESSILQLEDSDWAAGRDLGPPTPMMGTMILEEDTSSE